MANVTVSRTIDAPVSDVWDSWDDFANIYRFNPNLTRSFLINGSGDTGLGAQRQCDLSDGKNYIQEKIIEYVPHKRLKVDIFNGSMPLKSAVATFDFRARSDRSTDLSMSMDFTPKFGVLGLMMIPMMKPQFAKLLGLLLDGNKAYVERGEEVQRAA